MWIQLKIETDLYNSSGIFWNITLSSQQKSENIKEANWKVSKDVKIFNNNTRKIVLVKICKAWHPTVAEYIFLNVYM